MNRYVLEFEKDGKVQGASFDATDDEQAKKMAREKMTFLQEISATQNQELRHPELYRQIYGL